MNHNSKQRSDTQVPEGANFLRAVHDFAARCEERSDQYLPPELSRHLGTLLSLLDRASSCWWGCRGGDHTAKHIVGRCCSYAMAAFTLARAGFYDESLSLARTLGEIANLAYLFATDPNMVREWKNAEEGERREKFSPVKVRLKLEERQRRVPIDQSRYRQLSEKATHVTPHILPQMYNFDRTSEAGGTFQEAGLFFCLAEIVYPLSIITVCAVELLQLPQEQVARLDQTSTALGHSVRDVRERVNAIFPGTYSSVH